jgi:hypothetical protein
MSLEYADRVLVACSTYDADDFTIGSAIVGHRSFSSAITDGATVFYRAAEVDGDGIETGDWEIGYGTFASGLLTREWIIASSLANGAVPVIATKGTVASNTSTNSLSTNAPASVAVKDMLVLGVGYEQAQTLTTPTGWTLVATGDATASSKVSLFLRRADGTAADTPTLAFSVTGAVTAVIYRVTGVAYDCGDMWVSSGDVNIDANITIPQFNTELNNTLQIAFAANPSSGVTFTWPGTYTVETTSNITNGSFSGVSRERDAGSTASETLTTSGSTRQALVSVQLKAGKYSKASFAGDLRISVVAVAEKLGRPGIKTYISTTTSSSPSSMPVNSGGVWTKPLWGTETEVLCVGGGGGGGSGAFSAASANRGGAGGGGGGVVTNVLLKASSLNSLETVTVGAAGTGAVSAANNGVTGGATSFGSWAYAAGGTLGAGGNGGTGGSGGVAAGTLGLFQQPSLGGAAGGTATTGVSATASTTVQPTGGGGGGGTTSSDFNGGSGGTINGSAVTGSSIAGGAAGTTGNGGNGNSVEWLYGVPIGTGGGGGFGDGSAGAGATGGNGGTGGGYGAGGGGGGSATCASGAATPGSGGNGAPGICVVVTY